MPVSLVASSLIASPERSPIMPLAPADQRGAGPIQVAIAHSQKVVRAGPRILLDHEEEVLDLLTDGDAAPRRDPVDVRLVDTDTSPLAGPGAPAGRPAAHDLPAGARTS
jgi:hypothetical protein